jgi:hypothetical protein
MRKIQKGLSINGRFVSESKYSIDLVGMGYYKL